MAGERNRWDPLLDPQEGFAITDAVALKSPQLGAAPPRIGIGQRAVDIEREESGLGKIGHVRAHRFRAPPQPLKIARRGVARRSEAPASGPQLGWQARGPRESAQSMRPFGRPCPRQATPRTRARARDRPRGPTRRRPVRLRAARQAAVVAGRWVPQPPSTTFDTRAVENSGRLWNFR